MDGSCSFADNHRMPIRAALCVLVFAFAVVPAFAQVPPETTHAEVNLNFWTPSDPEITIEDVDFSTPLDLEARRFRDFRLRAGGAHRFRFSYIPVKYDDTGKVIDTTVTFQGVTYPVNVPVNYEFKWDVYRIGYEWDFARFNYGFIGLVTELKYNRVSAFIDSPVGSATLEEVKAPIPTIGGIARGYLGDYFSVTGEFTALSIDRDEFRGKFYDLDLYGQLNFTRNLAAQFGYRSLDVDYLVDGDSGVLRFKGTYFGGTLRF
jgi:hypothetical protein